MVLSSLPVAVEGLNLYGFLLLTASSQLLGGAIAYIFLSRVEAQEKTIGFIAFVLMGIVAFYASQFIAKQLGTLLLFFLGLGGAYMVHSFLMQHADVSTAMGIFSMIGIHEIIEGLFVSGMFLLDPQIGIVSGLMIALHEVPEGMVTGLPFFLDGDVRKGFIFILISLAAYVIAGSSLGAIGMGMSRNVLHYIDAFAIGAIVALGIVELQMLRKPS